MCFFFGGNNKDCRFKIVRTLTEIENDVIESTELRR